MSSSSAVAAAVISALRDGGVRDIVLAPGSRSAALAVALHQADALGLVRLHVRVDERSAGFLALGLAKGSHHPAAVVTTSGTAVANLHPAVLEAAHSGERLIVLSADRPAELRGSGANQTSEHQAGMFGAAATSYDLSPGDAVGAADAVAESVRRRGPSHLNLQFAEPLLGGAPTSGLSVLVGKEPGADPMRRHSWDADAVTLEPGPRTVVVAGDDAGPPARLLAQAANWPLLAEPTSGARTGSHALQSYRLLLATSLGRKIERVVVAGHPTLSRQVTELISRADIEVLSVRSRGGVCTDPGRVARHLEAMPRVDSSDDLDWVGAWRAADQKMVQLLAALVAPGGDALPLQVAAEVGAAVPPAGLLVVGSSQPIRDLDLMGPVHEAGQRRLIVGNRGLAGIDGTVSTAVGAALARRSSRALAYVGDVTFLHDMGGLVLGPDEPCPDLTVVVANDDGGSIFATLEQGAEPYAAAFERVFATPHGVDLQALCEATGTAYERVEHAAALRQALVRDVRGIRVVEVPIPRSGRRALAEHVLAVAETW